MEGIDGIFHLAALWLLHCYDYPRSAFEVNIGGTFNVLEGVINNGIKNSSTLLRLRFTGMRFKCP